MTSVKSAGAIPIIQNPVGEGYTFKHWNRVEFVQPDDGSEDGQMGLNKVVRCHKSNFEFEVEHIKKL